MAKEFLLVLMVDLFFIKCERVRKGSSLAGVLLVETVGN